MSEYFNISFDNNGFLYLDTNNKTYQLEIDIYNEPILISGEYNIIKEYDKLFGSITIVDEEKQSQEIEYENYQSSSIPLSMYPEEKGYMYTELNNLNDDDDDESIFTFMGEGIKVYIRDNENYNSFYDTFINKNQKTIFRTKLIGEPPLYVLTIENNIIYFRKSSNYNFPTKKFKIKNNNDNLFLEKI